MSQATSHASRKTESAENEVQRGPSFLRKFWAEISAVCLFGLGVFLLVEKMQIKAIIWRWLVASYQGTVTFVHGGLHAVYNWFAPIEVSDFVGVGLIFASIVIMIYAFRERAIGRSLPLTDGSHCLKSGCDGTFKRSRRNHVDRFTQSILRISVRPYSCRDCSHRVVIWAHRRDP